MDLCPRFDEALLRPWQSAADTLNRIEGEHRVELLVRRVEVRPVMWCANFRKHADDDSKEPRDFRTGVLYTVVVDHVGLTIAFQPRRLMIALAADGCKRWLG